MRSVCADNTSQGGNRRHRREPRWRRLRNTALSPILRRVKDRLPPSSMTDSPHGGARYRYLAFKWASKSNDHASVIGFAALRHPSTFKLQQLHLLRNYRGGSKFTRSAVLDIFSRGWNSPHFMRRLGRKEGQPWRRHGHAGAAAFVALGTGR